MQQLKARGPQGPARKLSKRLVLAAASAVFAGWGAARAEAGVTSFDDLPSVLAPLANGVSGFNWTNVYAQDGASFGYGYAAGVVSPANIAYNGFALPCEFGVSNNTPFDLNSVYLTAAWRDGMSVTFSGYVGNTLVTSQTVTPLATAPTLFSLNFSQVTKVAIESSGGTQHPGYLRDFSHFVLDDLSTSRVFKWSNASGGNWGDSSAWDLTVAPAADDHAVFDLGSGSSYAVNIGSPTHVRSLAVQSGDVQFNAPGGGPANVLVTGPAAIATGARLDLKQNKLITASSAGTWSGSSYTGITGLIESGRNGGAWNGDGIVTSETDAQPTSLLTTIVVSPASDALGIALNATGTWSGQTVNGSDTLVMYSYAGDLDLNGSIDGDDYLRIDTGFTGSLSGYHHGDIDYNGVIDADDYFLLDRNYVRQGSPFAASAAVPPSVSAVPEPGVMSLLIGSAIVGVRRRSQRAGGR